MKILVIHFSFSENTNTVRQLMLGTGQVIARKAEQTLNCITIILVNDGRNQLSDPVPSLLLLLSGMKTRIIMICMYKNEQIKLDLSVMSTDIEKMLKNHTFCTFIHLNSMNYCVTDYIGIGEHSNVLQVKIIIIWILLKCIILHPVCYFNSNSGF